eukprot:c20519_g1_i6.p1 GENE.c20519_g1_i6~~c20519_g1_i6.p1  ORF type:complete len:395 (-),score=69.78 c20519_g1_i6:81-1265(-)
MTESKSQKVRCCSCLTTPIQPLLPDAGCLQFPEFQISMVSMYRLPQKEVLVTSNPNVYRAIRCAYETFADLRCEEIDHLTISKPERVNFKKAGSTHALGDHMDVSPFHPDGQLPGLRIQGMQVLSIGEYSKSAPNGTLRVVKRFHRYARIVAAALDWSTGVPSLRTAVKQKRSDLHQFFAMPKLPLNAISLYIQLVESVVNLPGCEPLGALPSDGKIDGVSVFELREHALDFAERSGLEYAFPVCLEPLGKPLCWEPLTEVASGSLVLWDSLIPHSNVENLSDTSRYVAYLDLAPRHRPNGPATHERVSSMMAFPQYQAQAPSDKGGRVEQTLSESKDWAIAAEKACVGGGALWARGGSYPHVRQHNLLLKALYGFDVDTKQRYTWEQYESEYP